MWLKNTACDLYASIFPENKQTSKRPNQNKKTTPQNPPKQNKYKNPSWEAMCLQTTHENNKWKQQGGK